MLNPCASYRVKKQTVLATPNPLPAEQAESVSSNKRGHQQLGGPPPTPPPTHFGGAGSLGLPLGLVAPILTPNGVNFLFFLEGAGRG